MACVQQSFYGKSLVTLATQYESVLLKAVMAIFLGLHLVWSADMDRRDMHIFDDSIYMAVIQNTSQHHAGVFWDEYQRLCLIFSFLVPIFTSHLVPCASDQTPLHRQVLCRPNCWPWILWVVNP